MISIIIIVKNDYRIINLLHRLKKYNKEGVEIVVIDASQGKLDCVKEGYDFVKWHKYHTKYKTSIPQQRNKGMQIAKGDILVFIDSDCLPYGNWLNELIHPILVDHESIVAGHVIHSNKNSAHAREFSKNIGKVYIGEAPTMNLAIKREVIQDIGKFDNDFQCGEDIDYLWRSTRKGYRIRYAPNARIYHDLGDSKNELRRLFTYGMARVNLYRKHRYKQKLFWGNEIFKIIYPLYFIFLPITWFFHYYPLLGLYLLYLNRKANPFQQIYVKTIYGTGILKELFFGKHKFLTTIHFFILSGIIAAISNT